MSEWLAYNEIDPIGEWRQEFRTARLESLLVNIVSTIYHKKNAKPKLTTPAEFMPVWGGKKKPIQDSKSVADSIKRVFGSIIKSQTKRPASNNRVPVAIQKRQK